MKISAWTRIVLGSDQGMKPGDEAFKRFIASIFQKR
jgi:hypothetical protein